MTRMPLRAALAAFAVGAVALTALPAETTTAAFTATAAVDGATATAALPQLAGVAATHDGGGGVAVTWDELGVRPEVAAGYRVERTLNGEVSVFDVGDGVLGADTTRPPSGLVPASVTDISVGSYGTCVVASGEVHCWGNPVSAPGLPLGLSPTRVGGMLEGLTATHVSVTMFSACAIAEGSVYCWGRNSGGNLGDGTQTYRELPVKVGGLLAGKTATAISVQGYRSCAVADARAYCWGIGSGGGNGDGTETLRTTPVAVGGPLQTANVTDISVGASTCAVADGKAFCWGINTYGTIGDGSTTASSTPVEVSTSGALAGLEVTGVSASDQHTCAVADGRAFCWGLNTYGQLGDGTTTTRTAPVVAHGALAGHAVTAVSAGVGASCALADASVYCWGNNSYRELGDGTATARLSPVAATAVTGAVTSIGTGMDHSCVVIAHAASCWGFGSSGFLGTGTETSHTSPVPVDASGDLVVAECPADWRQLRNPYRCAIPSGVEQVGFVDDLRVAGSLREATQLSVGAVHTCAVAAGTAVCWGGNQIGQLGDGSTTARATPQQVGGLLTGRTVTSVAASSMHSCAIADSRAYCWGSGSTGQLGNGSASWSATPVAVGGALASATVTDLSASVDHTCAVAAGVAYCWGARTGGALGDGQTTGTVALPQAVGGALSGLTVTRVLAVRDLSCAIAHPPATPLETTVYCWGSGADGRLGDGTTTASLTPTPVTMSGALAGRTVTDISAASYTVLTNVTVCVIADADPFCWGEGSNGQLGDGSSADSSVPVAVTTGGAIAPGTTTAIDVGHSTACAVAADAAFCWGLNAGSSPTPVTADPTGVLAGQPIRAIEFGTNHGCLIADSSLHCWGGSSSYPLLGNGTTGSSPVLVPVTTTGVLATGECPTGWLLAPENMCAPGPGAALSYRVSYLKAGWSAPWATATAVWEGE